MKQVEAPASDRLVDDLLSLWRVLRQISQAERQSQVTLEQFWLLRTMEEADAYCDRVAIMDRGAIAVIGTPDELKSANGKPGATLEDVFTAVTGNTLESGGSYRERGSSRNFWSCPFPGPALSPARGWEPVCAPSLRPSSCCSWRWSSA